MHKLLTLTAGAAVAFNSTAAFSEPSELNPVHARKCLLKVSEKNYIDGPCQAWFGEGGSLQVSKGVWFAQVLPDEGGKTGSGFWNNNDGFPTSHAQDDLGKLVRDGACWENGMVKICVWK